MSISAVDLHDHHQENVNGNMINNQNEQPTSTSSYYPTMYEVIPSVVAVATEADHNYVWFSRLAIVVVSVVFVVSVTSMAVMLSSQRVRTIYVTLSPTMTTKIGPSSSFSSGEDNSFSVTTTTAPPSTVVISRPSPLPSSSASPSVRPTPSFAPSMSSSPSAEIAWTQLGDNILGKRGSSAGVAVVLSNDGARVWFLSDCISVIRSFVLSSESEWREEYSEDFSSIFKGPASSVAVTPNGETVVVGTMTAFDMYGEALVLERVSNVDDDSFSWRRKGFATTGRAKYDWYGVSVDVTDDGRDRKSVV